ncbi:unnamed protein product, partial [Anisakis simplex]|uniref:Uncharacterized protein n=1 Tax=Anisakis simplex TaxID=6269 RepID=A0A0M3J8F9_ANISI
MLDGYAELPVLNKKGWKNKREHRKSHHFGETLPEVPLALPRSTVSSGSNGFVVSDLRCATSGPSTNFSEHSRMASTNTDRSSSAIIHSPSSLKSKGSSPNDPHRCSHLVKRDNNATIFNRLSSSNSRPNSVADRALIDSSAAVSAQSSKSLKPVKINTNKFNARQTNTSKNQKQQFTSACITPSSQTSATTTSSVAGGGVNQ